MKALAKTRNEAGYTLAELLVAAAVVGLVMSALITILLSGHQSFTVGTKRSEAQQSARLVLYRMAEEIRGGGYDPMNASAFAAITALAPPNTGFTISNDWNATGAIETNVLVNVNGTNRGEQITYDLVGTSLRRQESQVDGAAVAVTDAIESITFQYLDANDVAVASPHVAANAATIRTVVVTVTTRPDAQTSATTTKVSVASTIRARVRNRS